MPTICTLTLIFSLFLSIVCFSGCEKLDENLDNRLKESYDAINSGRYSRALVILDELSSSHSNQIEVVKLTAIAHQRMLNFADAAFFFDIAASMKSGDPQLFIYAAQNFLEAQDLSSARSSYLKYLKEFQNDSEAWLEFAEVLLKKEEYQSALDTYLKGIEIANKIPTSEQETKLGSLFLKINNYEQAEFRFKEALRDLSTYPVPSLIGLLEVYNNTQNWLKAEEVILKIETEFPRFLEDPIVSNTRNKIIKWENARAAQASIEATNGVERLESLSAQSSKEDSVLPLEVPSVIQKKETMTEEEFISTQSKQIARPNLEEPVKNSLDLPVDSARVDPTSLDSTKQVVQQSLELTDNDSSDAANVSRNPLNSNLEDNVGAQNQKKEGDLSNPLDKTKEVDLTDEETPIESLVELSDLQKQELEHIEEGNQLLISRDFSNSVGAFWKALGINSQNASSWFSLSRAYLLMAEMENAEMTVMEAVRNDRGNLQYRIEYLKLMKKLQPSEKYLDELLKSKEDFPDDPTITLSLASAFRTIRQKPRVSALLYQEFLEKHPSHPLASSVKIRLKNLGSNN